MAHFAKLDENNVVIEVHVIDNREIKDEDGNEIEEKGISFLTAWSGGHTNWKQTSYNTHGNVHINGGTPFRKNYASFMHTYDPQRDAFIPPKPRNNQDVVFNSWVLDEVTCTWKAPIDKPGEETSRKMYRWDEANTNWVEYYWDDYTDHWEWKIKT